MIPSFKKPLFFVLALTITVVGVVVSFDVQAPEPATYRFSRNEVPPVEYVSTAEEHVAVEKDVAELEKPNNKSVPTKPPVTQAPVTQAPVSKPSVTKPSVTEASVTVVGILAETNAQRAILGLPPMSFNVQLAAAAQAKAADMISRQYFEHESPDGKGPGDLVDSVGYDYLSVAENLALGTYENSAEIVEGWMDSPGHRENIVSAKYSDIGVAVVQGLFEGQRTWLAVQEFGRPASECPSLNQTLEARIDGSQRALAETKNILDEAFREIDDFEPKHGSAYNTKVEAYNDLVQSYNTLLEETRELVEAYNEDVRLYNECVH